MQPAEKGTATLQELSQDFLIMWSNFYLVIEKEVLILKGKSFGTTFTSNVAYIICCKSLLYSVAVLDSYRILHAVLNDYIQYVMEMLRLKMIESQFTRVLISKSVHVAVHSSYRYLCTCTVEPLIMDLAREKKGQITSLEKTVWCF